MMDKEMKISICVPVYNNEKHLPYFLDSALQQSFDDYEIILADNRSTDASFEILQQYATAFPEKVSVYRADTHGGPGMGRNLAFEKSHGKYIYWCDCDDLIHPKGLEKLYEEAIKYDADIVCASAMLVREENGEIMHISPYSKKKTMQVSNDTAIKSGVEFWLRLIKRSLVERIGPIPDDVTFDDVRYITILQSYAETIRFLNFPIYYFFKRGRDTSITSGISKELCQDSIEAEKYVLQNCNQCYLEAVQKYVCHRIDWNLDNRWQFFDLFIKEAREFSTWLYNNEQIRSDRRLFDKLRWMDSLADIELPNIIYVNGFGNHPSEKRLAELREKVFHDGCEIVILSEETCNITENAYVKRAYDKGDLPFVTGYFALKKIYETGGIYIHDDIRILNYFGYLKYRNAFFSMLDKTTYSEWVFGGLAGNEAIKSILKTYSEKWDYQLEYMPLSLRISIILTAKYGIPQDGKTRLGGDIVSVVGPELAVVDTRFGSATKRCAFEHDFSSFANEPEYVTLPRSSLKAMLEAAASTSKGVSSRERVLERELADMKKTNTYKLMMKIRQIGDGPFGPFLKKIYHSLLKIRERFKRR